MKKCFLLRIGIFRLLLTVQDTDPPPPFYGTWNLSLSQEEMMQLLLSGLRKCSAVRRAYGFFVCLPSLRCETWGSFCMI